MNKIDLLISEVRKMSIEEFNDLIIKLGDKDIWELRENYYEDRVNIIDLGFDDDDINRYYSELIK
jgi:hypothetical protein